jgi:aspartate/methionine/tyrosine aminotransferase
MNRFGVAKRLQQVQDPVIPIVGEWVRSNPGTLSLGQGVVFYDPPREITEGLETFWADPLNHRYKLVQGIDPLLEAISHKILSENGIQADPRKRVVVTAGSNMAFMHAIMAIAEQGDEVILPKPYYFNHEMALSMLGIEPRLIEPGPDMLPSIQDLEAALTERTRAVVTVSPNNPSGAVYPRPLLEAINVWCRNHGLYHISDEAYEYFHYDGSTHFSPGSLPSASDHTLSLFSLSKSYGFASWRIGYMVIPPQLLAPIQKIQDTNLICAPVISQFAAARAIQIGPQYCQPHLETINRIRKSFIKALSSLEPWLQIVPAKGAFYLLLRLEVDRSSLEVVRWLIEQHHIALIPGTAFGLEQACYLRVAYGAFDEVTATKALERLIAGLEQLKQRT